jgi:DDE superfamily endonuclease
MEEVLDLYQEPYDPQFPLVCMDEKSKQLIADTRAPLPPCPGAVAREDHEYERNGTCNLFIAFEPLRSWRHVEVTDRRTAVDWAHFMKHLADEQYADAKRIRIVMDNLNTHNAGSFYEAFAPTEARRLALRFEFHYTPKHGSWLNMAEIELSALERMCLNQRLATPTALKTEVGAWEAERNDKYVTVDWRFTTPNARFKLMTLYPAISM